MRSRAPSRWRWPVVLGLVVALEGCGGGPAATTSGDGVVVDLPGGTSASGGPGSSPATGATEGWPAGAPADVPPFPGQVQNLMVGRQGDKGLGVRIFFTGVARATFDSYLGALRGAGYPADWVARVPPPDGCVVGPDSVIGYSATDINIGCAYPDLDPAHHWQVFDGYLAKLAAAGFVVTGTDSTGQVTLTKGSVTVRASRNGSPGGMGIGASDRG